GCFREWISACARLASRHSAQRSDRRSNPTSSEMQVEWPLQLGRGRVEELDLFGEKHAGTSVVPVHENDHSSDVFGYVADFSFGHRLDPSGRTVYHFVGAASFPGERRAGHCYRPPAPYRANPVPAFELQYSRAHFAALRHGRRD